MKLIVNGAAGRMGGVLLERISADPALTLVAACDSREGYPSISSVSELADVIIDFSRHDAIYELARYASARRTPVVLATTGRTADEEAAVDALTAHVAVFVSANMSIGAALLCALVKKTARVFPSAEVEIVERHHDRKLDVPSGTAMTLAETVLIERAGGSIVVGRHENGLRSPLDIGIHSLRLGEETGSHEVIFSCGSEELTLTHRAVDRSLFADGALTAAGFILDKPAGRYGMEDILEI